MRLVIFSALIHADSINTIFAYVSEPCIHEMVGLSPSTPTLLGRKRRLILL